jgi:hypothetical protein
MQPQNCRSTDNKETKIPEYPDVCHQYFTQLCLPFTTSKQAINGAKLRYHDLETNWEDKIQK